MCQDVTSKTQLSTYEVLGVPKLWMFKDKVCGEQLSEAHPRIKLEIAILPLTTLQQLGVEPDRQ